MRFGLFSINYASGGNMVEAPGGDSYVLRHTQREMTSMRGHLGHTQPTSIGSARSFLTREGRHFIPYSGGEMPGKVTTRTGTDSPILH
ncbi:hypothetical protein TcasGA2_TC007115 [Tribolium castaneum]|uniref:Uncharacterized protein n=1 Tax=Tribolium castaneum TaxID=7070 RepID=D2A1B4_TRICA|nr:hypothetical protein TcasGA2_TC007115 [Tribolium castaneum]